MEKTTTLTSPRLKHSHLFVSGHTACSGCGEALAMRLVLWAAGPNVIVTNATGCSEVFSSNYPSSAWQVPWIHSLFENAAAVAAGVEAALKQMGRLEQVRVIAQAGDGGTADIGLQALSGMLERGHDVLFVCYDNEAYMNTGVQRSGLTPYGATTNTSPSGRANPTGNPTGKKDMLAIVLAHGIPYAATASVGYPFDLEKKVKKALEVRGPKYIQIYSNCPLGWRHHSSLTITIAKLAAETGLFPLLEYENGRLVGVRRIAKVKPVEEYLRLQGRFSHLFEGEAGRAEVARIQAIANANIERYGLVARREE